MEIKKNLKMCAKARNRDTHGQRWKEKQKEEMMESVIKKKKKRKVTKVTKTKQE